MNPLDILEKYYDKDSSAFSILVGHSRMVERKSLEIAAKVAHLNPDVSFIREAAMLHDIGIFMTSEPKLGCYGDKDYICHGYLGRELLEREGLPLHALVCERHVGVGLGIVDIEVQGLPLPKRDMRPVTLEEKIICLADKFFSKRIDSLSEEKPLDEVKREMLRYGQEYLLRFEELCSFFSI
ncbi:MAG: HDIG domain-containing protein [Nitrospirae bacterium]|nr:HDIG domain-containing protein [Nitrospirota bacterium]